MKRLLTALLLTAALSTAAQTLRPDNIDGIISSMTLEEKIDLVIGAGTGWGNPDAKVPGTAGWTTAIPRLGIPSVFIADGSAGAINSLTAEYWRANAHPSAKSHLPKDFRYAGVVSCAGAIWHMTEEPVAWKSAPCPVLFFHGDKDRLIPYNELILPESGVTLTGPEQLVTAFETGKWPFMFYTVKEGDHLIANIPTGECNEIITAFVNRLCVNMEQVGIRIQEASLDSPHNYMWFFTERLGYSADQVRDVFGKVVENQ